MNYESQDFPALAVRSARVISVAVLLATVPLRVLYASSAPERAVHRYLEAEISPDAAYVAAVEGDSPKGGYYPDVRELVIRRVADGSEVHVPLPCGRVPQCWPGSLAWKPDGKLLAFTVRTPGSHAYTHCTRLRPRAPVRRSCLNSMER